MTGPRRPAARPRTRGSADPYGIGPISTVAAPGLALVGLVVVAAITIGLMNGRLPLGVGTGNGNGNGNGNGGSRTPAPSNVVNVDPRTTVPGSIVYVKGGNIWVQSGTSVRMVTTTGRTSMPTWSPDGQWIYYIEQVDEIGLFPAQGNDRRYAMTYPNLMRVHPDGSGQERMGTGKFERGRYTWFFWMREPDVSPDGRTVALTSDGPNPQQRNVVVQLYDLETREFSVPTLPENTPLGHQDPTWRPDGGQLLYVRNGRSGARGAPVIMRFDPATGRTSAMTGPGYLAPSWSPDGRFVAATRSDGFGTDVVVLDARNGAEVLRVTDDDNSWSPSWSPKGDAIAFLHRAGGIVDLRLTALSGTGPAWTPAEAVDLTSVSGLDGSSRPDWFIPADQLPAPTATPAASDGGSGSPPASGAP